MLQIKWPVGQAVKTPPFHGGITGSIPVRVIMRIKKILKLKELKVFYWNLSL
ncbi:hypothetical protein BN1423_140004 [Carnobacterium maltaromaticum]|nr:hypothetical protein BN1423_140004 [Carnobacterium maltaromaticum]